MNTIDKPRSLVAWTILLIGLVTVPAVHGWTNVPPAPMWGWPYDPMLMPYWGYWYSPCYPFASCAAYLQFQILERRQERLEELRRGEQPPASVGTQTSDGLAAGRGRAARPTDETHVQPGYIGSGQVRHEYQGSGEFLPEFLDGRVRPSR